MFLNKWFLTIVLNHKFLDIYFNGKIKSRKELTHLPRTLENSGQDYMVDLKVIYQR